MQITCADVRRELSNYIDAEITAELRARIEAHVASCTGCRAIFDGVRNVIRLVGGNDVIELPSDFSARLQQRLAQRAAN